MNIINYIIIKLIKIAKITEYSKRDLFNY